MCVRGTASTYDARAQCKSFCGSEYATEINNERANYYVKVKHAYFLPYIVMKIENTVYSIKRRRDSFFRNLLRCYSDVTLPGNFQ